MQRTGQHPPEERRHARLALGERMKGGHQRRLRALHGVARRPGYPRLVHVHEVELAALQVAPHRALGRQQSHARARPVAAHRDDPGQSVAARRRGAAGGSQHPDVVPQASQRLSQCDDMSVDAAVMREIVWRHQADAHLGGVGGRSDWRRTANGAYLPARTSRRWVGTADHACGKCCPESIVHARNGSIGTLPAVCSPAPTPCPVATCRGARMVFRLTITRSRLVVCIPTCRFPFAHPGRFADCSEVRTVISFKGWGGPGGNSRRTRG